MLADRTRLLELGRLDEHVEARAGDEKVLLARVALAHDTLHRHADLLHVPRLEEVLVCSRVQALPLETRGQHVSQLPSLVVRVANNSLENALTSVNIAVGHRIAAQFDEEVIDSSVVFRLFDVLDEVNFKDVND